MKNLYVKLLSLTPKVLMLVALTAFAVFTTNAQSITINDFTVAPYYTFGDLDVDYTADGYPAGTTFYLIVDTNSNGFLDAEDDVEDYVLASSTSLADILEGEIPNMTGNLDFWIVAGEDGTIGDVVSEFSEMAGNLTTSGTVSVGYPLLMDQDMIAREITTPDYDLTSDHFFTLVLDVDATDVVPANELIVEYSTDMGANYSPLTDQQGDASISESNGELVFALSQTLNTTNVRFRISQNNGATIAAATETWALSSIDLIEYSGTFVQFNEESVGTLFINSPTITPNSDTFDPFIGEDVEVDYSAFGFTSGATFYLYNGTILDPEDRTIFDTEVSINGILASTWPLDIGDQNVDVNIAGIYGNIDDPMIEFENADLSITGSSNNGFGYQFSEAGIRSATTDILDLSGEDYVTLSVTIDPNGSLSIDNAILIQYTTDDSNWIDLEEDNGLDEITSNANTTYDYTLPNEAKTATTRIRVRQKAIDLAAFSSYWFLNDMSIAFYVVGADVSVGSPFVSNYSVTVSSIEDADEVNISGGSAYAGDEITVTADAAGFDVNTEDYTVLINNTFLLDNEMVVIDGVTDEIVITGNIPTHVEYTDNSDIQVKIYDGAVPLVAVNENVFADYNEEEDLIIEGDDMVEDGDTKVEFSLAGERSLTTPSFSIASTDDLTLTFTLSRTNSVRSPSGTEVVVEFSTDGTSFTEIQSFSINEAGESGETYELDNTVLPAGMASPTTWIRFRQASNNGVDLDVWELQNITLMGGTNILDPGYINYNGLDLDVLAPAITLMSIDNANLDLYPSGSFDIEFEVEGEFPAGTTYELILDRPLEGSISFGEFTVAGTHSVAVPSVVSDTYDLLILASHQDVESNSVELVVGEVLITNIAITSADAVTDGNDEIVYPGNVIDITYEVVGEIGSGASINLEIYDNETEEYMMIVEGEDIDGILSATLPLGIDYEDNNADFRFTITNGNLSTYDVSIDENWGSDQEEGGLFFPVDLREGAYSSGSNYFLYEDGMRSAISIPLDFTLGGRVSVSLTTFWYDHDEDILLQYSLDDGDTWEDLETGTLTGNSVQVFPGFIDMPEEAWTDNVLIRFVNTEIYSALVLDNGLALQGLSVENFHLVPIAEEGFTLKPDLILEELSVSVSTLEETDFILGEEFVVEYNAEGPFPSDVEFAIVMGQSGEYVTLAESDQTGAVQVTVNIPSFPFEDTDLAYDLEVIPFVKEGTSDVFRAAADTEYVEEEEDIIAIEGRATSSTGSSGYSDFRFNQSGDRSLLTRAFDLEDFGSATLEFDFTWYDGDYSSLLTLPELQASTDAGATFQTLEIADAIYETEGLVYPSGSYSVEIPEIYLTAATHFRWIQKLNLGLDKDNWRVYNIEVVKGESNALSDAEYVKGVNLDPAQTLNVIVPNIDNYIWEQSDPTDAAFNGESFSYDWNFDSEVLDESNFPSGTEYVFTIDIEDPETGENIVIGTTSTLGSGFTASVPLFVENGTYSVMLTATITEGDEVYYLFEEEHVSDLDVFLKAISVEYLGDENAVIYAGNAVSFGINVENDESTTNDFSTFNSNLILEYGGDDWLLASQLGIGDISVDLPSFVSGNKLGFRVELSENGAIGDIGAILNESAIGTLEDSEDNFISGDVDAGNDVSFESSTGRGLITTRDFEVGELDDALLFEFDITFDQLPEDLTTDQSIIFEFSTDGGATYSELASFPEADAEETLNGDTFGFEVTSAMKTSETRFRWRQEEIKGGFYIEHVGFTFADALPFDYIGTEINVARQALLITNLDSEEACIADDITLSYEIRGRFGAENMLFVYYEDEFSNSGEVGGYQFNISEGKGDITFKLPSDVLESDDNNREFKFELYAEDYTFVDINEDFDVSGAFSEESIEVVAPIPSDASFNLPSQTLCDSEEIIVSIDNVQNYFTYELFNVADASSLGTLTYDPDVNDTEINIGLVTESIDIGIMVSSSSSSGNLTCNANTSTYTEELEVLENYELNVRDSDISNQYEVVVDGDGKTICEEASSSVVLRIYRPDGSWLTNNIEWFRDDLNTPISTFYQISNSELSEAGAYFARVNDGTCSYLTESYLIENVALPAVPEITVVSGSLGTCDGDGEVVLEATAGFTYYKWSTDETTQSITVDVDGDYYVEVSNIPFSVGCSSRSETLELETTYSQEFTIRSSSEGIFFEGGETLNDCDATTIQFYDAEYNNLLGSNGGIYTVYRGGVAFATTTSSSISIGESGEYSFEWTNDALNGVCTTMSPTITINISESIEEAPVVTVVSGDLTFCEGTGEVVLSAPDGFSFYQWSGGSVGGVGTQTITVTEGGSYSVQVSNLPFGEGCASPSSANVVVTDVALPDFGVQVLVNGSYDNAGEGEQFVVCDETTLRFLEDGSATNSGIVRIFRNGTEIAATESSTFGLSEGGSYTVEWTSDDDRVTCTTMTGAFDIIISDLPTDAPVLTSTGDLTFCSGGGSVILTAPAGFGFYDWYGGSISSQDGLSNSNTIEVTRSGTYSVQVGTTSADGDVLCLSPSSNEIVVNNISLPNVLIDNYVTQIDGGCGEGGVTFSLTNSVNSNHVYQLINAETGQPSGQPVAGNQNNQTYLTSDPISEETFFYLEVSYVDGSGCSASFPNNSAYDFSGIPNNVVLELEGATLVAKINGNDYMEIRWLRNGVKLNNKTGFTSINITDGATYTVEVDYPGGCTVTSNAIDLTSTPEDNSGGRSGGRIVASTYPNPSSDYVNIELDGGNFGSYQVDIMTMSGQVRISEVLDKQENGFQQKISIAHLDDGIYNLQIRKGKESKNFRIVKTK
ncbi:MAG: T9SS type A sorting domain-containing protein [Cyclobacteriaceae bacterium]